MAHLKINLSKIQYNALVLKSILEKRYIHFTPVIKCVAGDKKIVDTLSAIGIRHFADARMENISKTKDEQNSFTMIRTPNRRELEAVTLNTQISIQTELETIERMNEVAKAHAITHQVLLMVDWKDAREGVLPFEVVSYVKQILSFTHIKLIGLAFNFMCFRELPPTEKDIDQMNEFITYVEDKTNVHFQLISGGNSSMLPLTMYQKLGRINELRIGETLFRGVDTTKDQAIPELYQDAITLETEIVEIKPRLSLSTGQSYLQAILDIGHIDTAVEALTPLNHSIEILGATSDHVMVNLQNQDSYQVGDKIQFKLGYKALAQSMYMLNIQKKYYQDQAIQYINKSFNRIHKN